MALLPEEDGQSVRAAVSQASADSLSRDIMFLFGHEDAAVAESTAAAFARALADSDLISETGDQSRRAAEQELSALLFRHRSGLLSDTDRLVLRSGQVSALYQRALAQIFSPIGSVDSRLLLADPFQLFFNYVATLGALRDSLVSSAGGTVSGSNGKTYAVVSAKLAGEPYALSFQRRFMAWFDSWEAAHTATLSGDGSAIEILRAGAIFYAYEGARQGLNEATVIGGFALVGVIVLVLLAFGSLQPIGLTLLSILSGLIVALSVNLLVFDSLHFIAVLFGAGLIGISVDYSLHYCCERFGAVAKPRERLDNILPAATLGLVTSSIGFLTLAWAPFPGLRQIALFAAIGLAAAYLTVVIWFPVLDRSPDRKANAWLMRVATEPRALWHDGTRRLYRYVALAVLAVAAIVGGSALNVSDDLRRFQALSADLVSQEQAIREITGLEPGLQFYVVTGSSDEEVLATEELLRERLAALRERGGVTKVLAISQFVPSEARQAENAALVQQHLGTAARERLRADTGLPIDIDDAPENGPALTLDEFRAHAPRALVDLLIPNLGVDQHVSIVLLRGVSDVDKAQAAAADIPGVEYVDPAADISALFRTYRKVALILLGVSVLVMVPVLVWRYRPHGAFRILLPPVASVVIAPCVVALTGEPITFFNVMALVLVFAIGIDYAFFCRESHPSRLNINALANGLAAASTILSFGLLAFSGIPVVHSFGLTVFVGILIAFLLAPLAERTNGKDEGLGGSARNT